jgi:short-subunit dehydrogenase
MKAADARVLLTGASGGIGRAVATALRDAGAALLLSSRSPAGLAAQARALAPLQDDRRVAWQAADLTRSDDVAALSAAARAWGANVVVHNAGVPSFGRLESLRPETIVHALHTNLLAPVLLTRALLPHLRRQPHAQVICVGSALGRIGLPGFSVYSAGKFGLRGFAEALRRELGDGPVQVQYLGPRSTRTAFNDAGVEAYNRATGTAMDPPERVAAALLRLLEDEAAERYLGFPERLAVRINGFAAPLLDASFARHRRSLPAMARDTPRDESDVRAQHTLS